MHSFLTLHNGLTSGEKQWLLDENYFLGSSLDLLEQRDMYVTSVEKLLVTEGTRESQVQLFREQQLTSSFTFLEKLTEEVGYLIAKLYSQSINPTHINSKGSILETTRKYFVLVTEVELPSKDVWDKLINYRTLRNKVVHGKELKYTKQGVPAIQVPGLYSPEPGKWTFTDSFWPNLREMMEAYTREFLAELVFRGRQNCPPSFAEKYGGLDEPRS